MRIVAVRRPAKREEFGERQRPAGESLGDLEQENQAGWLRLYYATLADDPLLRAQQDLVVDLVELGCPSGFAGPASSSGRRVIGAPKSYSSTRP
jgi:hypothetical protein